VLDQLNQAVVDIDTEPAEVLNEGIEVEGSLGLCMEVTQQSGTKRRLDEHSKA
jgi:hypothetical protein